MVGCGSSESTAAILLSLLRPLAASAMSEAGTSSSTNGWPQVVHVAMMHFYHPGTKLL